MSLKSKLKRSKSTAPHLIIIARAGTGKTTTLIEGLKVMKGEKSKFKPSPQQAAIWESIKLSKDASSVAFCAFNRSIANELKERVPGGCIAMTMHSHGMKAVMNAYGRLAVESNRTQMLLAEMLGKDLRKMRREFSVQLKAVTQLVGLCKSSLLEGTEEDLDQLTSNHDIDLNGSRAKIYSYVPRLLEISKDTKDRMIDFDDMIWLPIINNLPATKFDLMLIDESQDLNRCQQALALKSGRRLVFCGDPKQAIYGFAGADSKAMETLENSLEDVVKLPLTVTRRCGKAIVEEAKRLVPDFEAHESNGKGLVSTANYEPGEDGVKTFHTDVQDGDMVLCRTNAPLVQECFRFLRQGRKASIQGRDIGSGLIRTIKSITKREGKDDLPTVISGLGNWYTSETKKENAKNNPSEQKLQMLSDRYDCLMMFCEDKQNVEEVIEAIESMFTDKKTSGILLSSGHKAKGLEANRVFLLDILPYPHPMATTAEAISQERNLRYVCITRAIEELVYVS